MLKNDKEKIVINDHIQGDPLLEKNLDKTLNFLHEIRLLMPEKTIWLYSGFVWEDVWKPIANKILKWDEWKNRFELQMKRQEILENVDVFVDGRYMDSQRDISLRWRGSKNQRVIDVQKSLEQNKVVLYCN